MLLDRLMKILVRRNKTYNSKLIYLRIQVSQGVNSTGILKIVNFKSVNQNFTCELKNLNDIHIIEM